jgi:very-short-patch-repair endonuclease
MPSKHNCCFTALDEGTISAVLAAYKTKSQAEVCAEFGITRYALLRMLKIHGGKREKYGKECNALISEKHKQAHVNDPSIAAHRAEFHRGSKRSVVSRAKMQASAWKRMESQKPRFVSGMEKQFGLFLTDKLGISCVPQFRVGGKPFDFLLDGRVLLEFDGPHHYKPDYYLWKHRAGGYEKQQERDKLRHNIATQHGYELLVVRQDEVNKRGHMRGDGMHQLMHKLGFECA